MSIEGNRKYDTLTKNALIDDILAQVRQKKQQGTTHRPQPGAHQVPLQKKETPKKPDAPKVNKEHQDIKPLTVEKEQQVAEQQTNTGENLLGDTGRIKRPSKEVAAPASVEEITTFFSIYETPDEFLPPEELAQEEKKPGIFGRLKSKFTAAKQTVELPATERESGVQAGGETVSIDLASTEEVIVEMDSRPAAELTQPTEEEQSYTDQLQQQIERAGKMDERQLLAENRREKLKNFSFDTDYIQKDESLRDKEPALKTNEELEQGQERESAEETVETIMALRDKLRMRMGILAVLGPVLTYLNLGLVLDKLPLPSLISPIENPIGYFAANLLLLGIAFVVCSSQIVNGALYGIRLKGDSDSPLAFAYLASLIQGVAMLFMADDGVSGAGFLFSGLVVLSLWFSSLGKLNVCQRILRNYRFLNAGDKQYSSETLQDDSLREAVAQQIGSESAVIGYRKKLTGQGDFFDNSFSDDMSDRFSCLVAPITLALGLAGFVYFMLVKKSPVAAFGVLSLVTALGNPMPVMLAFNLPFSHICKKINRQGGVLSGYQALDNLWNINTLSVTDADLFPAGCVQMHGIKTFGGEHIDVALVKTASVLCRRESAVSRVFSAVIEDNTEFLLPVESLIYENDLGYSCWIDNKRTLVGNRAMMQAHGIQLPSNDFEKKYRKNGKRELLYLSVAGELVAFFVISYTPNQRISALLSELYHAGVTLAMSTGDPNLSLDRVQSVYQLPDGMVGIVHSQIGDRLAQLEDEEDGQASCGLVTMKSFASFAGCMLSAIRAKSTLVCSVWIQNASVIVALLLGAYMIVSSGSGAVNTLVLLVYQLIWTVLLMGYDILKKK